MKYLITMAVGTAVFGLLAVLVGFLPAFAFMIFYLFVTSSKSTDETNQ